MKYKSPNIGSFKALLPFLIFIAIYLGAGIYFQMQGVDMAFYQFPSVTAMFIAVLSAFCLGSEPIMFKFGIFSKGAANDNIKAVLPDPGPIIAAAGLAETARAEEIPVSGFVALANALAAQR